MDAARWDRLQSLFHAAAALETAARPDFLAAQCADDPALAGEVLAMLAADAAPASLLDRGVAAVAGGLVGGAVPLPPHIGPYRIVGLAGEGGMGVVYRAERDDLGSRAAVKVLRDATLSPLRRERFTAEQRMLARLEHPGIARLYDADALPDGTPYFVMEYVDGVPLTRYVSERGLTTRQRLALLLDVCAGVQYAHAAAVIHRDLKPSNILVRSDGVVKLLDFGIARQLESLDSPRAATVTAQRLMTPAYAAPEQLTGGATGTYTDVYALGVILYELLCGSPPFDSTGLTPGQFEHAILEHEPERPSAAARRAGTMAPPDARQLGASAWHDLDVLCLTAMHKNVDRRYRTVEALVRDVRHFLAQEPLEARPDSTFYRLDRFLRRNRRATLAAGLVVAMVGALTIFYTASVAAARDAALVEAERAQQIHHFVLNLFQGGDEEVGPADSLRVVTLIERGIEDARSLAADPRMQAELYATLGSISGKLGDFTRADSLLTLALEQRRTLLGTQHADVASSLIALGSLRVEQAEFDEGVALIRDGLERSRRTLPPGDARIAAAAAALGQALQARGAYADAIPLLEEAVRLETGRESAELAHQLSTLAATHYYAGNYTAADSIARLSRALNERLFGARHPNVADDLIALGAVRYEMGAYGEAEALYREALAMKLEHYGPDHYRIAAVRTVLGRALVAQERFDEALEQLAPALQIRERVLGPGHPAVASALNEIGSIALYREDYATAEASFQRTLAIYETAHAGRPHSHVAVALSNLASVYMDSGDYGRAEAMFRRVIDAFREALSDDHTNTAIARLKLGRSLRYQNRCREAIPYYDAGYASLTRQVEPGNAFLQAARGDLALCHEALGRTADGARWREEHARYR